MKKWLFPFVCLFIGCGDENKMESLEPSSEMVDNDGDGFTTDLDCDDNNSEVFDNTNDLDCDGFESDIDCNDNDPNITNTKEQDQDCDLVTTFIDCDDNDPLITNTNIYDADCDLFE